MKLLRVNNRMKKKDGEEFVNPNFGRFFFARKVQATDEDGNPAYNDRGYPIEDLADFQWFDESNYVRSGAFAAIGMYPDLSLLMMATKGVDLDPQNLWPVAMIKALA